MNLKKQIAKYLPYVVIGLFASKLGLFWRIAEDAAMSGIYIDLAEVLHQTFATPWPSLHPFDLSIGAIVGALLWFAVYIKQKNAKKYRKNEEYGSARWGTKKDIQPFMDPKFENNVILTQTERLMMNNRPLNPAHARNKNVLVIGGSGSGKTRYFVKPNLLQCHSSYVVTDPKGSIIVECGRLLRRKGIVLRS